MPDQGDEYARVARIYDPATAWALDPLRRELAALAGRLAAGRVLDVCCGTGRQCLFYARAGLDPVGLDASAAMLRRAVRAETRQRGRAPAMARGGGRPGTARFVRGDAAALPFGDAGFGFSSVCLALHERPPWQRPLILAELLRVTAPGGVVAVLDYLAPRGAAWALAPGIRLVERLAGREHHARYAHFMAHGGLEGFLEEQGLVPDTLLRRFGGLMGLALMRRPE